MQVNSLKKNEQIIEEKLRELFHDPEICFDKTRYAGGMTNNNYIMEIQGNEYVIREPGFMTAQMIDRKAEGINNNIASDLGINSNCVFFDHETGIKISSYIKNSKNIALSDPSSQENIVAVCDLMKKIHQSQKPLSNVFDWQLELEKYERIIDQLGGELFSDYSQLKEMLLGFMAQNITSVDLAPCHNDTVPENFITSEQGRTYLIDWEYSGMNDPAFDIAAYMIESRLPHDSIQFMLDYYYQAEISVAERKKIQCYMMAQDLLWTIWALIRHYGGDDFLDYCSRRYDRFKKNIIRLTDDPDFSICNMVDCDC